MTQHAGCRYSDRAPSLEPWKPRFFSRPPLMVARFCGHNSLPPLRFFFLNRSGSSLGCHDSLPSPHDAARLPRLVRGLLSGRRDADRRLWLPPTLYCGSPQVRISVPLLVRNAHVRTRVTRQVRSFLARRRRCNQRHGCNQKKMWYNMCFLGGLALDRRSPLRRGNVSYRLNGHDHISIITTTVAFRVCPRST